MKKLVSMLVSLALLCAFAGGAYAQTITFDGTADITLTPVIQAVEPADDADDGYIDSDTDEPAEAVDDGFFIVQADSLTLLGLEDDGRLLAYAGGQLGYIDNAELAALSIDLNGIELPVLSELSDITYNSPSSAVYGLQEALSALGYLSGSPDGSFGNLSRNAVMAFQEAMGLESTGVADAVTQQLLSSLAGEPITVLLYRDPTEQYAPIMGRTDVDITPLFEQNMTFDYDDITGVGFISNGNVIKAGEPGNNIDSYEMEITIGYAVSESEGVVHVAPALKISSVSVRRPLMQTLYFKSGDTRLTAEIEAVSNGISGSRSVEDGMVTLNWDELALLAGIEYSGELKLRVEGKYSSYDLAAESDQLSRIAQTAYLGLQMVPQ